MIMAHMDLTPLAAVLHAVSPNAGGHLDIRTFFYQEIGPGWKSPGQKYAFFELLIVFSGEGRAAVDGTPVTLRTNSVLLTGPNVRVAGAITGRMKVASFHFDVRTRHAISVRAWEYLNFANADEIEERCVAVAAHPAQNRLREVILEEILLLVQGAGVQQFDSRLYPVMKHIEYYKGKEHCAVRELCAVAGLSPRHLNRLFRAATGQSPLDYCMQYRIGLAKTMLRDKGKKVHEVAQMLGYTDVFLFIRQFKRLAGKTPKQYQMTE